MFVAAVLYSMVGHGGATAYLMAMALCGVSPAVMKPAALAMNVVVAAAGTLRFARAGLVPWTLVVPLCVGSIPAAFAGGAFTLPGSAYKRLLGATLVLAATQLWHQGGPAASRARPAAGLLVVIGATLGLLAGLTGIGGGVYLSPLLLLAGLTEPRPTAGATIVFILANSAAGLIGFLTTSGTIPAGTASFTTVALAGGLCGSWLGAHRLPPLALRRVLAVVLLIGGVRLLLPGG